jgi:hypothetical protein
LDWFYGDRVYPDRRRGDCSASFKGDAAVLADRESVRREARAFSVAPSNDNAVEGVLPSLPEALYLRRGLAQPGGKLPLFDLDGQDVDPAIVRQCLDQGWAEPWFNNPLKPDWLVCKLTDAGRRIAQAL